MDNLTHTLVGVALARSGLSRRYGRGTTLLMAVASNLPDIDVLLTAPYGAAAPMLRRSMTHSVVGIPVLAIGLALVARRWMREVSVRALVGLCLLALGVHVLFDLVNSYGVVVLWPLRDTRFELAWVFIIDLFLWAALLLPIGIGRTPLAGRIGRERTYRAAVGAVVFYLVLCAASRSRSMRLLSEHVPDAEWRYAFVEPLGPHRWRGVTRTGDHYRTFVIRPFRSALIERDSFRTELDHPSVAAARATEFGITLDWFFKAPVWRVLDDGTAEVFDLRFRSYLLLDRSGRDPTAESSEGGSWPFVFRFPPGSGT